MKKLFLFLLATTCLLFSATAQDNGMTIEEIDAWLAPNPAPWNVATELDYKFARFQTKAHINKHVRGGINVVVPVISAICTTPQMDIEIPSGFLKSRGYPEYLTVTLRDFTQRSKDLPNNKTIFALSASDYRTDGVVTRKGALDSNGAELWDQGVAPWIGFNDFLNITEAKEYWESE